MIGKGKAMSLLLLTLLLIFSTLPYFFAWLGFPQDFQIIVGNKEEIQILFPFNYYLKTGEGLKINGEKVEMDLIPLKAGEPFSIESMHLGEYELEFFLFGFFPLHQLMVRVLPKVQVYPGGHSIGVVLDSEGVMIKDHNYVLDYLEEKHYPARDAGMEVGDRIIQINGVDISSRFQVSQIINGREGENPFQILLLKKDGRRVEVYVDPVWDQKRDEYRLGIFLDDGSAGVGTLTFYEEKTAIFGALGHMVTDLYTNHMVDLKGGQIVLADIAGINQARRGLPGEKMGVFLEEAQILGKIDKNTSYGIFGHLYSHPQDISFQEPVTVATSIQIEKGPATIYTVLEGELVEGFAIEIEGIRHQGGPGTKGLIIRIVDERLLEKTGGIVQGMSGSPIIQNNRLVGAITHVFVNDPARGYGVLAQWMIYESGILEETAMTRGLAS